MGYTDTPPRREAKQSSLLLLLLVFAVPLLAVAAYVAFWTMSPTSNRDVVQAEVKEATIDAYEVVDVDPARVREERQFEARLQAAQLITDGTLRDDALVDLCEDATGLKTFNSGVSALTAIRDPDKRLRAATGLALAMARSGNSDALTVINHISTTDDRTTVLADVARAAANARSHQLALDALNMITTSEARNQAAIDVARILSEKGQAEHAIEATHRISDTGLRNSTLARIASGNWPDPE